jgi:glutathione synthase/RimK-type ligase-like ATP-grasp enzyme
MPTIPNIKPEELNIIKKKINNYIVEENMKIVDFFHNFFSTIPHLGCYCDNNTINKIYNLYQAQKEKILIPDFLITRNKADVELFITKHPLCIIKGIDRNGFCFEDKISFGNLAKLTTASELAQLSTKFNYSFIQQYIDKKADVRIFYIGNKIYSTAIFSQNDEKTKVDFRNYNHEKPNRIQPFKLPDEEEKKMKRLMKTLNYQTGSIDYVLDKNNDLYFLEINPVGQYGFISDKCNLFLDKAICNYFKTKCNE